MMKQGKVGISETIAMLTSLCEWLDNPSCVDALRDTMVKEKVVSNTRNYRS